MSTTTLKNSFSLWFVIFVLLGTTPILYSQYEPFGLFTSDNMASGGGVAFNFFQSGYSDGWYWGLTTKHPFYSHEMLSGEWASGILYNGSHNGKTEWLPTQFIAPTWSTDGTFLTDTSFYSPNGWAVWNNNWCSRSRIYDPNLLVTIDSKIVDLGANGYASLPFYYQNYPTVAYVQSERYILVQTYNITNTHPTGGSTITGLKFYQMLRGLFTSCSSYSNAVVPNMLPGSYDPCNPNSPAVFKYATTLWNDVSNPINSEPNHYDWECFSSTLAPSSFENGLYDAVYGGDSDPCHVTYDIKNSRLNGVAGIYNEPGAVAGAMCYILPDLPPQHTTSITFAVLWGCGTVYGGPPKPVHNITKGTGFDYWTIQTAINNASNGNTIVVDPGTYPENVDLQSKQLTIRSDDPLNKNIVASTIVSPTSGTTFTISSDADATISGFTIRNGSPCISISNSTAAVSNCTINCVGTAGISISGSTAAVSNCVIDSNYLCTGVDIESSSSAWITNCEIYRAYNAGVTTNSSDANLTGCIIDGKHGSSATYGVIVSQNLTVQNCTIQNNVWDGIYGNGFTGTLICRNSRICGNGRYGIDSYYPNGPTDVNDCFIYHNGNTGIYVVNLYSQPVNIINDTVYGNTYSGIDGYYDNRPLTVKNCIAWNNGSSNKYNVYCYDNDNSTLFSTVTYSCIQGGYANGGNNINPSAPGFVNADTNDFHLASGSGPCVNVCDGYTPATGEVDIDGDSRKIGSAVDMGADEYNPAFSFSGVVNCVDFGRMAKGWNVSWIGTNTAFDPYDFATNQVIGFKDLRTFVAHWLDTRSNLYRSSNYVAASASGELGAKMALYLTVDCNSPDSNSEVTVYIHSQTALSSMSVGACIDGEASITTAMSTADCNQYGWEAQNSADPNIEPNTVQIAAGTSGTDQNSVVGYFKIHYNYGPVHVAMEPNSTACDSNGQPVAVSTAPLSIVHVAPPGQPSLHLVPDNNMPDANSNVTISVYSDVPLSSLGLGIEISGDANFVSAMDANDCNSYGWQSGWWTICDIDPNGTWAYIGDYTASTPPSGNVGYYTMHYNSGQVTISVYSNDTVDANQQPVYIDAGSITIGSSGEFRSNMMIRNAASDHQSQNPQMDIDATVKWLGTLWNTDPDVHSQSTESQWQDFINNVKSSQ
jgi:hypothetical protein